MEFGQTFNDVMKFAITLLSITNPLGAIPIFLGYSRQHSDLNLKKIVTSCVWACMITVLISLICGQAVLNFFGISIASFTIGGGLLLFTVAFSMISGHQSNAKINNDEIRSIDFEKELGIIPLAIPLISGPGAISTSIIHAKQFHSTLHWVGAILVVALLGFAVHFTLKYAEVIGKKLGQIGLNVMTRIMGLILLSMSIEMIAGGLKSIIPLFNSTH